MRQFVSRLKNKFKINGAEAARHMGRVAELGCIVCRRPALVHHINCKTMGRRANNFQTIPLCSYHHDAQQPEGVHHLGTRVWEKRYGTEYSLLRKTMIEIYGSDLGKWPKIEE